MENGRNGHDGGGVYRIERYASQILLASANGNGHARRIRLDYVEVRWDGLMPPAGTLVRYDAAAGTLIPLPPGDPEES